eukprot:c3525_g1_i3.p1 GENE.c3525_g1_i3~~c3525_g1_i3.p1  ORF type:complete len:474 (+),score=161.22 c3525_g1_i3:628-2049(+)
MERFQESFLDMQDEQEMNLIEWEEKNKKNPNKKPPNDDDDENDDDSVDLLGNLQDDAEEEDGIKFADFFDRPKAKGKPAGGTKERKARKEDVEDLSMRMDDDEEEDGDEDVAEADEDDVAEKDEADEEGGEGDGGDSDSDGFIAIDEKETDFELKEQRMKERIKQLEEKALQKRTWELMGEAKAKDRPVNSLLQTTLDFEHRTRPKPLITEDTTKTLEKIIKSRILSDAFDDVIRKLPPNAGTFKPRKQALDHEKSKLSLAEIYEKEFAQQVMGQAPVDKLREVHKEVQEMWEELCNQLDALTNYQFTPKRISEELKVIPNVAAVRMEEAMPELVSEAHALAPEEVHRKQRGDLQTDQEMSKEQRRNKRATNKRRASLKKASKEHAVKTKEALTGKKQKLGEKEGKEAALAKLHKEGGRNVQVVEKDSQVDTSQFTKSSKFFSKIQEFADGGGQAPPPTKRRKRIDSAATLKL